MDVCFSGAAVSEDGKFLVCDVDKGCDPANLLYFYEMKDFKYGSGLPDFGPVGW